MQTLTFLFSVLSTTLAADAKSFDRPDGVAVEIRTLLAKTLVSATDSRLSLEGRLALLNSAAASAIERLPRHSPVSDKLAAAVKPPDELSSEGQLARIKQAVVSVLEDLTFEPVAEADLPEGFPTYTPVGLIELKQYPAYRMAAGPGFWTLFMHIQLNRIAMTAPVQMAYSRDGGDRWKEAGMAFLYGDKGIGRAGRQGKVTVLDQRPQTVVSLGLKGKRAPSVIADAQRRLQRWIDETGTFRASGEVRVMGYNSPYVPEAKQYFEVQIPLEAPAESATASQAR